METENTRCTSFTDVKFIEQGIGRLNLGLTACTDLGGERSCNSADVIVNIDSHQFYLTHTVTADSGSDGVAEPGEFELNMDMTECHEVGHTVGIAHQEASWYRDFENDCMRIEWLEAERANDGWRKYNAHNGGHVDDWNYS